MANHVPMRLGKLVSDVMGFTNDGGLEEFCQMLRDTYNTMFGEEMLRLAFDIFRHRRVMKKMLKEGVEEMDMLQYLIDNQKEPGGRDTDIPVNFTINDLPLLDPIPFKDFPESLPRQTHPGPTTLQ